MGEPDVVFLAVGGDRRRGVIEAAGQVVAAGGRATVIVGASALWDEVDPRVRVVALDPVEGRRVPMRVERGLLHVAPGALLRGVGRLAGRSRAERLGSAYRRRFAERVERRVTRPALRSIFGDIRPELVRQEVAAQAPGLVVIADAASLPLAAATALTCAITFNVDDARPADPGPYRRRVPGDGV
jgi:hypothetical protein